MAQGRFPMCSKTWTNCTFPSTISKSFISQMEWYTMIRFKKLLSKCLENTWSIWWISKIWAKTKCLKCSKCMLYSRNTLQITRLEHNRRRSRIYQLHTLIAHLRHLMINAFNKMTSSFSKVTKDVIQNLASMTDGEMAFLSWFPIDWVLGRCNMSISLRSSHSSCSTKTVG